MSKKDLNFTEEVKTSKKKKSIELEKNASLSGVIDSFLDEEVINPDTTNQPEEKKHNKKGAGRPEKKEEDKKLQITIRIDRDILLTAKAISSLRAIKTINVIEKGVETISKKEDPILLDERKKFIQSTKEWKELGKKKEKK